MTPTPLDIAKILHVRDQTHVWHWQTTGYEIHSALGGFYEAWIEKADELIETISRNQRFPMSCIVPPLTDYSGPDAVIAFLQSTENWIKTDLSTRVEPNEIGIENIVADLLNLASHTLYKLSLG